MRNVCPKCKKREELFPYHVLPQQWYHGAGKIIFLCNFCSNKLDKDYSLQEVLCTSKCENRVNIFLKETYSN
ncbi:hypothetical protein CO033_00455 [Candidatus Nomurabacteria bacterium CG_4_9_14_0_2_um_filter_32_10]|uniref:HNH endonuclease n=3 Tax=Candidatus Nomuraibacteriota TaxID=1752729 RepID=A0A2H0CGP1_9BACT|nr:MAG: hypothetical protein COW91_01130 [Candidatus Nomurabacteria bacterium CG22_combo_CG10-13_8_21_14_all_32_8]PIZ85546.1 MAG: hypothetical protein COX94_02605 [Candidatus Nomurabacteria bacterium CG_4_10_14_0_2_um_filter_33_9]PJC49633.1 MAG: hypothetical protein CO033_00455 [Candidatus Nomurabacteria bacterium CG_4_9_14_0_2_um_filter_32_10]